MKEWSRPLWLVGHACEVHAADGTQSRDCRSPSLGSLAQPPVPTLDSAASVAIGGGGGGWGGAGESRNGSRFVFMPCVFKERSSTSGRAYPTPQLLRRGGPLMRQPGSLRQQGGGRSHLL